MNSKNFFKELRVLIILIFCALSFFFVKENFIFHLLILVSIFLIYLSFYLKSESLSFSKQVYLVFVCLANVFTLFFMIQYLVGGEYFDKIYFPFKDTGRGLLYTGWIFILTSLLLILEKIGGGDSGR